MMPMQKMQDRCQLVLLGDLFFLQLGVWFLRDWRRTRPPLGIPGLVRRSWGPHPRFKHFEASSRSASKFRNWSPGPRHNSPQPATSSNPRFKYLKLGSLSINQFVDRSSVFQQLRRGNASIDRSIDRYIVKRSMERTSETVASS